MSKKDKETSKIESSLNSIKREYQKDKDKELLRSLSTARNRFLSNSKEEKIIINSQNIKIPKDSNNNLSSNFKEETPRSNKSSYKNSIESITSPKKNYINSDVSIKLNDDLHNMNYLNVNKIKDIEIEKNNEINSKLKEINILIDKKFKEINAKLSESKSKTDSRLNEINSNINETKKFICSEVNKQVENNFKVINEQINDINTKINKNMVEINSKIENQFSEINDKITEMDSKYNKLDTKLKEVNSKLDNNYSKLCEQFTICTNEIVNLTKFLQANLLKSQSTQIQASTQNTNNTNNFNSLSIQEENPNSKPILSSPYNTNCFSPLSSKGGFNLLYSIPSMLNYQKDPRQLSIKLELTNNAATTNTVVGMFSVFQSLTNKNIVAYATKDESIAFFDLDKNLIIHTIRKAHYLSIYTCRHYTDSINEQDLIITSSSDLHVKIWEFGNEYKCLVDINTHFSSEYLYSANILFDNDRRFIIASAVNNNIKIFKFNTEDFAELGNDSNNNNFFTDVYYENDSKYIISCGSSIKKSSVNVYDFNSLTLYHNYVGKEESWSMGAKVIKYHSNIILIVSYGNGHLQTFNFHNGVLLKTIQRKGFYNVGLCVWNTQFVFTGDNDSQVKLYDIINCKYVKGYKGHRSYVLNIEKFNHPTFGECIISHSYDGNIKIWA